MGRSQDSFGKKEVRNKKEKKRKEKEKKRLEKREKESSGSLDDMIAYVDAFGNITATPPDPQDIKEVDPEDIEVSTPKKEDIPYDPIRKGIVSFLNESKGFGFIKDTETQESIFVHVNNTLEEIKEGNLVSFEVEMGPKGPSAIKVKVAR
ncbi:MAG: cold shock domain-containing protein [Bacteroidales bacterium]|jgi:cold shock CspA family protein|nr:cold shock domain-containing protein [Bacteroidales bacterium]NLM93269.1 cold shock domain-containing protein [Bacteroidales bacterium]